MITFARTNDLELVREILTKPSVWPHIGDDSAGDVKDWLPNRDPRIWYLTAHEGAQLIGLLMFLPRSSVLWEAHIALLKRRQSSGQTILAESIAWMFTHSTAERIRAEVPACNRLAVKLADRVMERIGTDPGSFCKGGMLQDLLLFGLSKCLVS